MTLDLQRLNRVLEVDTTSQAARIQAGTLGSDLERQLKPTGLTMRFFGIMEARNSGGFRAEGTTCGSPKNAIVDAMRRERSRKRWGRPGSIRACLRKI
jgi:hypothetical protein